MILQGYLRMEYNGEPFEIMVKTFLKNEAYYFYISDKEKGKSLLAGKTLELTFTDSFCKDEKKVEPDYQGIRPEVVSAIQNMLLENKQLWFY